MSSQLRRKLSLDVPFNVRSLSKVVRVNQTEGNLCPVIKRSSSLVVTLSSFQATSAAVTFYEDSSEQFSRRDLKVVNGSQVCPSPPLHNYRKTLNSSFVQFTVVLSLQVTLVSVLLPRLSSLSRLHVILSTGRAASLSLLPLPGYCRGLSPSRI